MKQVTLGVSLLALGLALGLVLPRVFAQSPQAERARERAGVGTTEVQKWEQFCERHYRKGFFENANASMAAHGKKGYELVTATLSDPRLDHLMLCYRRPAR